MKELFNKYRLFLSVGVVGAIGALVQALFLVLLVEVLHVYPVLGNTIAAESVILMNFLLNNYWTFRKHTGGSFWVRLITFNTVVLGSIVMQAFSIWVGIHFIDARLYLLYMAVGIGIGWVLNYILFIRFVWFRPREGETAITGDL